MVNNSNNTNTANIGYHDNDVWRWIPGDGLGQAQQCGEVKLINEIPIFGCFVVFYYRQTKVEPNHFALI